MNRKEFINSAFRYGMLTVIVGLVAFLATNRKTTPEPVCDNDFACGRCSKRENCTIEKK